MNCEKECGEDSSYCLSRLYLDPLRKDSTVTSLTTLMQIIQTSIGPFGKLKILQHKSGGGATATSSSRRLFHQLPISNIFSKTVASVSKTQLAGFNDGGLYCSLLALKLVNNSVTLEHPLPLLGASYESLLELYMECLHSDKNSCVAAADFSNLNHLKSLLMTVFSSKPGCIMNDLSRNHIVSLILEAFLSAIPGTPAATNCFDVNVVCAAGIGPMQSELFHGTLVPIHHIDLKFVLKKVEELRGKAIRVALFTASLAGDVPVPAGVVEVVETGTLTRAALELLETKALALVADGVGVVFCQKVVHPTLRRKLRAAGIIVFERLGSDVAKHISYAIGGVCNSSITSEFKYGSVSNFSVKTIGEKHFLLIGSEKFPSHSLLIGNYNEESLAELKWTCQQGISSLLHLLKSGKVCSGGGCLEVHTMHLFAKKLRENWDDVQNALRCTSSQLQLALDTFVRSVTDVCAAIQKGRRLDFATENIHGHLWRLSDHDFPTGSDSCACNQYSAVGVPPSAWSHLFELSHSTRLVVEGGPARAFGTPGCIVLDEMSCKANALRLAFEAASLLLRTSVCVNNLK